MSKENAWSIEKLLEQGPPEILTKPLPQILDEMEANIRAAAEAARRAEEAAKAARGAAGAATTASTEAAERAVEARQAGESAANAATKAASEAVKEAKEAINKELLKRIEALENRLNKVEDIIPKQKTVILREITSEEAKSEIEKLFKKGNIFYYSDIAEKLRIDLELVVEICEELVKEGKIKVADGS